MKIGVITATTITTAKVEKSIMLQRRKLSGNLLSIMSTSDENLQQDSCMVFVQDAKFA